MQHQIRFFAKCFHHRQFAFLTVKFENFHSLQTKSKGTLKSPRRSQFQIKYILSFSVSKGNMEGNMSVIGILRRICR